VAQVLAHFSVLSNQTDSSTRTVLFNLLATILNDNVTAEGLGTIEDTRTLEDTARAIFSSGVLTRILDDALYSGPRDDDCTGSRRVGGFVQASTTEEKAIQCVDALTNTLTTARV
jgi:hypothetical protein